MLFQVLIAGKEFIHNFIFDNGVHMLDFSYEGTDYSVTLAKVVVCPQCYSAVASRLGNMKGDYLVVDIGSKTTDVVYVQNGFPVESRSITIEKAMVKWMKEIQRDMKVQTGKDIPEHEVMKVLLKEESHLPPYWQSTDIER